MSIVSVNKLQPEMVLSDDVKDPRGRLLLARGSTIDLSHKRIFKIWGVTEVNVFDRAENKAAPISDDSYQRIEEVKNWAKHIFRHNDLDHPAVREIFRLSVEHRSKNDVEVKENRAILNQNGSAERHVDGDLIEALGKRKIRLPEIPSVVSELNDVITNPISSAEDIANVVNKSPSLTAILLKIVNSALYACPAKIDRVSQAVTMIGTREIFGLATGISVLSLFKKIPKKIINMYDFLKHSMACGIIARILASYKYQLQTEQLFVSGLLHDLGRVLLYILFPEDSLTILSNCSQSAKLLYNEETDYWGCNHTHIVQYLIQQWKLPTGLEHNVFYHHNPSEAKNPIPAGIVHIADLMTNAVGLGSSGEQFVPTLDHAAWEALELSVGVFEDVIGQAIHQLHSIETIMQD